MRISPIKGLAISRLLLLVPAREDALQGDDEVQHERRHPVLVRLTAAHIGNGRREDGYEVGCGGKVPTDDLDLAHEWLCHRVSSFGSLSQCSLLNFPRV